MVVRDHQSTQEADLFDSLLYRFEERHISGKYIPRLPQELQNESLTIDLFTTRGMLARQRQHSQYTGVDGLSWDLSLCAVRDILVVRETTVLRGEDGYINPYLYIPKDTCKKERDELARYIFGRPNIAVVSAPLCRVAEDSTDLVLRTNNPQAFAEFPSVVSYFEDKGYSTVIFHINVPSEHGLVLTSRKIDIIHPTLGPCGYTGHAVIVHFDPNSGRNVFGQLNVIDSREEYDRLVYGQ